MDTYIPPGVAAPAAPAPNKRIEALDVLRGFALVGICLFNVMFFNRSALEVQTGFPPGLTGADYAAAYFIGYFVAGKFWTIFSLLFGMGFAVMLARAEQTGRPFMGPYLRRIAALAVFGALHHIFIWGGDILFSYALAALFLLMVLHAHWLVFVGVIAALAAATQVPGAPPTVMPAVVVTLYGLAALYLRCEKRVFGQPLVSVILLAVSAASAALVAAILAGAAPKSMQGPAIVTGVLTLLGYLLSRYREPAVARTWRLGVMMWMAALGTSVVIGTINYVSQPAQASQPAAGATAQPKADPAAVAAQEARAKALKARAERIETDTRAMTSGTYEEAVALRWTHFKPRYYKEIGLTVVLLAMFLIGTWFIRSGVMANTGAHLPLFRRLAVLGVVTGVGLGLVGSTLATGLEFGVNDSYWPLANGLVLLGSMPASIGYVSLVILALHSRSALSKVSVLAPYGRMALTNYIMQSAIMGFIFYGYGLGNWGMGRANQLLVALAIVVGQVILSHVWLSRFRYGPLEWMWRAVTHLKLPPMRVERAPVGGVPQPN